MVEVPNEMPTIRMPLIEEMSVRYGNNYDVTELPPIRDFELDKRDMIAGIMVLVYIEKKKDRAAE